MGGVRNVSASTDSSGNLWVMVTDPSGRPWNSVRWASGSWNSWNLLNTPGQMAPIKDLASSTDPNGNLWILATDSSGVLWNTVRWAADGSWNSWNSLATPSQMYQAQDAAIAADHSGNLWVVSSDSAGNLWTTVRWSNGSWNSWNQLPATAVRNVSEALDPSSNLWLMVSDTSGRLWNSVRWSANGSWNNFNQLSTPAAIYRTASAVDASGNLWVNTVGS